MTFWWALLAAVGAITLSMFAIVLIARRVAGPMYTVPQAILFFLARLLVRMLWRAELPESLPIATGQGAVVVANHRSSVDPFFLQVMCDRPMHWMVAREYCEHPLLRWFFRTCEVIPVSRGGIDTAATKTAIRLVSQGHLVGMLPEGRINMSDEFMLAVRPGAALVALKARSPILPCYIEGSPYGGTPLSPFRMRARVRLVVGKPIELTEFFDREDDSAAAGEIMLQVVRKIARLAGRPDFEPKLAGRRWKPTEDELRDVVDRKRRSS